MEGKEYMSKKVKNHLFLTNQTVSLNEFVMLIVNKKVK